MIKIGVLALQGDFREHIKMLVSLGVDTCEVRLPKELDHIDGLIIPGGESTTIVQLIDNFGMTEKIKKMVNNGLPTWGTCAGMIVLAKKLVDTRPVPLGLIDVEVKRNAFGSQIDSFQTLINVPVLGPKPFPAVFIRAPAMKIIGSDVRPLAYLNDEEVIAARRDKVLVTSFHPELTEDDRFHAYFSQVVLAG